MADEEANRGGFTIQQFYCEKMSAPIYARICGAIAQGLTRFSRTGARVLDWPGEPTRDALPLRLMGGLHALILAGKDARLAAIFSGEIDDSREIATELNAVLARHDDALLPWLDGPPQTNEAGRSGPLMLGLLEVARRYGPRVEILEIGSSGGLNLLIGRYRFDLGGTAVGPADAPVQIAPEWQGAPPAAVPIEIVSARGCDVAPLDPTDPAIEARLSAYVWAETPDRMARLRGAIAMLRETPVQVDRADAADWLDARLAEPQADGVTRVLMHSVVWQYLPDESARRISEQMETSGAAATAERPLAWVMMEPNRWLANQYVRVRGWPEDRGWETLATTHAHGSWIKYGDPGDAVS